VLQNVISGDEFRHGTHTIIRYFVLCIRREHALPLQKVIDENSDNCLLNLYQEGKLLSVQFDAFSEEDS
jgi:hypothetical protein